MPETLSVMEVGVMPKEYVISRQARRNADEVGGRTTEVKVGWDKLGYVQIGTVLKGGIESLPPGPEPLGPDSTVDEGWFVDLDREALNDLIRLLRKARDAAYGRDE